MYDCIQFSACEGDVLLYDCYLYRGHLFRRYPDGRLSGADDADRKAAAHFAEFNKRRVKP